MGALKGRDELVSLLEGIDGRGYGAYKEAKGAWDLGDLVLLVDHVQGDPFAAPSRVRARLSADVVGLTEPCLSSRSRRDGVAAHLARALATEARRGSGVRGSGRSGLVGVEAPGQEVLPQTAVLLAPDGSVEARFTVGLPARGRRVLGREAARLLATEVPGILRRSLPARVHAPELLRRAAEVNEDADRLRDSLPLLGLVAFVADGARLPRRSGVDDGPLEEGVVAFRSPDPLRVEVELPNGGRVTGMGIPEGVTLVVGGGFHGKSTLLRALERGVYNHLPGDGRERVVTVAAAVKVRAEDGRAVAGVDVSPFIDRLPMGTDTRAFTTSLASGSTSQAAALVEAIEAGATAVLVDEDTAATNFMIRDRRMQALVPREAEPITPFLDRVQELHTRLGVSSVLVVGGSGDYLDVADTVVAMRDYVPHDVTARAREVAARLPTGRVAEAARPLPPLPGRVPLPDSVDPRRGRKAVSVTVRPPRRLEVGRQDIDLSAVEQLVSTAQLRGVGQALVLARARWMDGVRTLAEILDAVEEELAREGLDVLDTRLPGDLAGFRRFELAAALNRLRTLQVDHASPTRSTP